MAHKDIRIPFIIDGRNFEALGFLNQGEPHISGREMLLRTNQKNAGVIGDKNERCFRWGIDNMAGIFADEHKPFFLGGRLYYLPGILLRYGLVGNWRSPHPNYSEHLPFIYYADDHEGACSWKDTLLPLGNRWDEGCLVVSSSL